MEKTWLEVEMEETIDLLRKKLEMINTWEADELSHEDIQSLKDIYKTIYYIKCIKKEGN